METKKARYHITITDNKTGKIEHDADACVIIGAFGDGAGVANLVAVDAGPVDFAKTLANINKTVEGINKKHPMVAMLASLLGSGAPKTTDEETPTEETGGADCE